MRKFQLSLTMQIPRFLYREVCLLLGGNVWQLMHDWVQLYICLIFLLRVTVYIFTHQYWDSIMVYDPFLRIIWWMGVRRYLLIASLFFILFMIGAHCIILLSDKEKLTWNIIADIVVRLTNLYTAQPEQFIAKGAGPTVVGPSAMPVGMNIRNLARTLRTFNRKPDQLPQVTNDFNLLTKVK